MNGFNQGPEFLKEHPLCGCEMTVLAYGVWQPEALAGHSQPWEQQIFLLALSDTFYPRVPGIPGNHCNVKCPSHRKLREI